MSFKREGNDKSQLNILKKRRVADLLSNFIPEDEAALIKNGRYTCLVCSYRPVFDTVDMLTVHRKGKRHLEGLKAFYGKKAQLRNEMTKKQHEIYVQCEDKTQEPSHSAPLLTQTRKLTHHALLNTVPYNSCHRKTSTKCEKRTPSIGLHPSDNSSWKTTPEQADSCLKSNVSDSSLDSSATGRTGAAEAPHPSEDIEAVVSQEADSRSAQRSKEVEHYLRLKRYKAAETSHCHFQCHSIPKPVSFLSQGWLQDRSGRWIKDENVEFDSDEEEPPQLALASTNL